MRFARSADDCLGGPLSASETSVRNLTFLSAGTRAAIGAPSRSARPHVCQMRLPCIAPQHSLTSIHHSPYIMMHADYSDTGPRRER